MIDYFILKDEEQDGNTYHEQTREEVKKPMNTQDDVDFTEQEIKQILGHLDPRKTPGEDGITSKILLQVAKAVPKFVKAIYNKCLENAYFPQQRKKARLLPIMMPGKYSCSEVNK